MSYECELIVLPACCSCSLRTCCVLFHLFNVVPALWLSVACVLLSCWLPCGCLLLDLCVLGVCWLLLVNLSVLLICLLLGLCLVCV